MSFSPQNKLPINLKFFNKPELRIGFDGNIRKIKRVMNSCHVERTVKNEKKNFDTFDMHRDPKNTSNLEEQASLNWMADMSNKGNVLLG